MITVVRRRTVSLIGRGDHGDDGDGSDVGHDHGGGDDEGDHGRDCDDRSDDDGATIGTGEAP